MWYGSQGPMLVPLWTSHKGKELAESLPLQHPFKIHCDIGAKAMLSFGNLKNTLKPDDGTRAWATATHCQLIHRQCCAKTLC